MANFPFTLRQLEVFSSLCATRSFRRSAEMLGISQASVSNQMKALEDQLGITLFARRPGQRPTLTPEGMAFLDDLRAFRGNVEAHADAEETEILPLLEQHRSAAELQMMEAAFKTAEMIAPTHAHRFAPESAIGNLLLGPAVAVVDRIRDLLPR